MVRPRVRMPTAHSRYSNALQDRDHLRRVTPLPRRDQEGKGPQTALTNQVNLRGESTPGTPQSLVITVPARSRASARDARGPAAGAACMLVSAAHRRVHAGHAPVDSPFGIRTGLHSLQDSLPRAVRRPSAVPVVHGLPFPEPLRKVSPGNACAQPEQDPIDYHAMALPSSVPARALRQMRFEQHPLRVRGITPPHAEQNDPNDRLSHDSSDTPWTGQRKSGPQSSRIRFGPSTRSLVKRRPPSTGTPQWACQRPDDTAWLCSRV